MKITITVHTDGRRKTIMTSVTFRINIITGWHFPPTVRIEFVKVGKATGWI